MLEYTLEKDLIDKGYTYVCGVDEAGRGPLCGPVVTAAVILPCGLYIEGLNDSKKLTEKKREALYDVICKEAIAYSICYGTVEQINDTNILQATMDAMKEAINTLSVKPDFALIDGNIARDFPVPASPVVHGDAISPSIAAASILAKVTRDRLCVELDAQYPMYGIAKHKGYGTKDHMEALRKYGPAPIYRTKFIRFLNNDENS
ncbi:MAG: ribonuclease HII [Ruminococcaceae bacterium]|nr:ribonuclease HII [Oscillospiraceae bacterium]